MHPENRPPVRTIAREARGNDPRIVLFIALFLALFTMLVVVGQTQQAEPPSDAAIQLTTTIEQTTITRRDGAPPLELSDLGMKLAIERELARAPGINTATLDIDVSDGIATITGSAPNVIVRDRVERIAATVRGVTAVVNHLTIESADVADPVILANLQRALGADPALDPGLLQISIDSGIVTLSGSVDSWRERWLAEEAAKNVYGVRGVVNQIQLEYPEGTAGRADDEIQQQIIDRINGSALIDAGLVAVGVRDGQVSLSGIVPSLADKVTAMRLAWVSGVTSVTADELKVDWELYRTQYTPPAAPSDAPVRSDSVREQARDALMLNPYVEQENVEVVINNGVATLSGTVRSLTAKREAAEAVRHVGGIFEVRNNLMIDPGIEATDAAIAQSVSDALRVDPVVEHVEVDVAVDQGIVTLRGQVDDAFERARAEEVAGRIAGAVAVANELTIAQPEAVATPSAARSDAQIAADIESELFWSALVDPSDVQVQVQDGVATLRGRVDDSREYGAAIRNAFEGGARSVVSELTTTNGPVGPATHGEPIVYDSPLMSEFR
ncbi:MAG TPA: BON domain-containing protein [Candidatus Sumerlaeota bacterium]|nr:BON domain-containing protein [Candidatus Sumerlaeota bacterium]